MGERDSGCLHREREVWSNDVVRPVPFSFVVCNQYLPPKASQPQTRAAGRKSAEKQAAGKMLPRSGSLDLNEAQRRWSLEGRRSLETRRNSSEYRYGTCPPSRPVLSSLLPPSFPAFFTPSFFVYACLRLFCACVSVSAVLSQDLVMRSPGRRVREAGKTGERHVTCANTTCVTTLCHDTVSCLASASGCHRAPYFSLLNAIF